MTFWLTPDVKDLNFWLSKYLGLFIGAQICQFINFININQVFFSIGVFFHDHSRIAELQGKGEDISFNSSPPLPAASETLKTLTG